MPFHSLCMTASICDYCGMSNPCSDNNENKDSKSNNKINLTRLGYMNGVYYCSKCIHICKKKIIEYINLTGLIPLFGMMNDENSKIKFYRKSKKTVYEGKLDIYEQFYFGIRYINTNYVVKIIFDNGMSTRDVLIENIFYHNPGFYDKLISCKNLFNDNNIIISFNDLSSKIKDKINNLYKNSKNKKSSDFIH